MSINIKKSEIKELNDFVVNGDISFTGAIPTMRCYLEDKDEISIPRYQAKKLGYKVDTKEFDKANMKFKGEKREYQEALYPKIIKTLRANESIFLSLHCAWGKTAIAIKLACEIGMRVLCIADQILILNGWYSAITKYTDQTVVLANTKTTIKNENFVIASPNTVSNMNKTLLDTFGLVIIDEAIAFCTQIRINTILMLKPKYIIGLSADNTRNDGFHKCLYQFFGQNNTWIREIWHNEFFVYKFNTPFKPTIEYVMRMGRPHVNWAVIIDSLTMNNKRNQMFIELAILNKDKKIIMLTERTNHCKILESMLLDRFQDVYRLKGKDKKYPNCRILIATYKKAGKGFDQEANEIGFDNKRFELLIQAWETCQPEQPLGRIFRSKIPICYDFVDDYSILIKHFNQHRKKWYKDRKAKIIEEWL